MEGPIRGGKRPNAGRRPGIPNKATIERALITEQVMARATMEAKPLVRCWDRKGKSATCGVPGHAVGQ
jgi:hypothetical protein